MSLPCKSSTLVLSSRLANTCGTPLRFERFTGVVPWPGYLFLIIGEDGRSDGIAKFSLKVKNNTIIIHVQFTIIHESTWSIVSTWQVSRVKCLKEPEHFLTAEATQK